MHLVSETRETPSQDRELPDPAEAFVGTSLSVLFAEGEDIERLRRDGPSPIVLRPPYHVGEEDAYLLLPEDIGIELVDILHDGDAELIREAMRDGLLVLGQVGKNPKGRGMALDVLMAYSPAELLAKGTRYAANLTVNANTDPLRALNTLPHLQCTTLSALVDDDGLEAMLREGEYIGTSWRPPASAKSLADIEPTHVWSRHLGDGQVGIELALFQEDDELIAVLRPARLCL